MTDRYNYLIVGLEQDIREDDAQALINAILMMRGVLKVEGHVSDPGEWIAQQRVRQELRKKLWNVLFENS